MKHIKKRFLNQILIEDFNKSNPDIIDVHPIDKIDQLNLKQVKKGSEIILYTEDYAIKSFLFKDNKSGNIFPMPEPDPVLIYFNFAQSCFTQLSEKRHELIKTLNPKGPLDEDLTQKVFNFFGLASSCIIFLATSLEAFINQIIPDDYEYQIPLKNRTEFYSKSQIQKHHTLRDKFAIILPKSLGMEEIKSHQKLYKNVTELIDLRNDLIHTKDERGIFKYADFSGRLLNHDFEKSISTVRDAINHFKPNYIEECDCGKDF
jgi:hypothetical protein